MKKLPLYTLAISSLFASGLARSAGSGAPNGTFEQGEVLFRSFRGFCPSHGEWVDRARNSAKNLSSILSSIKDDPACKSISSSLQQLQTLQMVLDNNSLSHDDLDYEQKKRQRYEYLMQLQSTKMGSTPPADPILNPNPSPVVDTALVGQLESSLRDLQIQIGSLETKREASNRNRKEGQFTQQSVFAIRAILTQSLAQQDCFIGKPHIFETVASLAGSVSAVALTGGASLGVAAGVELLGDAVEYSRKASLQNKIAKINEASIHEAFSCALEAMSDQWCGAKEAKSLYEIRNASLDRNTNFQKGVRYLERELPVFLAWLEEVQSGSRPSNEAEANRKNQIVAKEAALKAFPRLAYAKLEEMKQLLPTGNSPADLKIYFDTMRNMIMTISQYADTGSSVVGVSVGNPILDVFSSTELPWILAGLNEAPFRRDSSTDSLQAIYFDKEPAQAFREGAFPGLVYPLNPGDVERQIEFVVRRGQERLALERSKILQVDPRDVLWAAESPDHTGNIRGVSPLMSIQRLTAFLAQAELGELSPNQRVIYRDTQNRLQKIEQIVEASISSLDDPNARRDDEVSPPVDEPVSPFPDETERDSVAQEALDRIYSESYLEHGTAFFAGRLRRVIRHELINWIFNEEESGLDPVTSAQLLASQDILEEFESFGTTSPTLIESSLSRAIVNTFNTSQSFAEVFADNLSDALSFYSRMAREDDDHLTAFNDLCMLLLAVPHWDSRELKKVPVKLCEGVQKQSVFSKGRPSYKITKSSFSEPYKNGRACHYRNFARQEKIIRDLDMVGPGRGMLTPVNLWIDIKNLFK